MQSIDRAELRSPNSFDRVLDPAFDFDRLRGQPLEVDMKHGLTGLLLAGATCAFVAATPAVAQVAGNPGDLHSPTVYTTEARANAYGYAPGSGGPLGPLGVLAAPIGPVTMMTGGVPSGGGCGVNQDFNGRLTAFCGL
jgi:hypothetical protein